MARLGKTSIHRLQTCHKDLQALVMAVAAEEEVLVVCGARTKEEQAELLKKKLTKTLDSKHCKTPSEAVDLMPLPLDWTDYPRIIKFGEKVMEIAKKLYDEGRIKSKIRWGGDFNMNGDWKDEKFRDFVHFEIV